MLKWLSSDRMMYLKTVLPERITPVMEVLLSFKVYYTATSNVISIRNR